MGKMASYSKTSNYGKKNIQVDKLLQPRPENEELDYPTEPHYEPVLSDETTVERRQREQRNVKRRTDWQNTCKDIEDKGPQVDNIPWEEADNKIPHIPLTRSTSNKHFPLKIPTHRHTKMHHGRTSRTTQRSIHTNKERNI